MACLRKLILFALGIALMLPVKNSFAEAPVSVCGEPWAPFFYESGGNDQKTKEATGLNVENFRLLEELTGLKFTFEVLPWKRCLHGLDNYSKPGDQEIATDAGFSTERAEKYYYVGPMYALGTAVFYSRNLFPDGPLSKKTGKVISRITEMQDYSICGILGWNYEMYYVEHGMPRSVEIIRTPAGYQGAFGMVSRGRCDLIEIHPALVLGAIATGELDMPEDIACLKLYKEHMKFYMMIARKSPRAKELVTRLSKAVIYLQRTLQWKSHTDEGVLPTSEATEVFRKCLG